MAHFKFSLSWSLCFWEQPLLIVLSSMGTENTKINKSRFLKILHKDKSVLRGEWWTNSLLSPFYYYGINLQCVSFRPTPGGAFPNTYLFRDGEKETSTTSQSLIHTQEWLEFSVHEVHTGLNLYTWFSREAFSFAEFNEDILSYYFIFTGILEPLKNGFSFYQKGKTRNLDIM